MGAPFPRQQDLNPDAVHVGLPPGRRFTLSHGWSSEFHPCPSGVKMQRLAAKLVELGADKERDGVFVDYCSLSQKAWDSMPDAYFDATKAQRPMLDKTPVQHRQFGFAMWESEPSARARAFLLAFWCPQPVLHVR